MADINFKNLKDEILRLAGGEPILYVVAGHYDGSDWRAPYRVPKEKIGKLLTWDEAGQYLDYEYDDGYGGKCHPFFAWTPDKIIFVADIEGTIGLISIPRNPIEIIPNYL